MQLFRSEDHVQRWLAAGVDGRLAAGSSGATISVTKLAELADAWWRDRLDPGWQPHTLEQNQAILDSVGLTGEFWRLG